MLDFTEDLKIQTSVDCTVFDELLIGAASILSFTPPSHTLGSRFLSRASTIGNSVDTEIVYGQGTDAEYVADTGGSYE